MSKRLDNDYLDDEDDDLDEIDDAFDTDDQLFFETEFPGFEPRSQNLVVNYT